MIRMFSALVLLGSLCGCSSSREGPARPAALQDAPGSGSTERPPTSLRINEVMILNVRIPGDQGKDGAWIEVINDGAAGLRLASA